MIPECVAGAEVMREIQGRAAAERLPLSGSLALTHRCNFRCVHCYAATPAAVTSAELDAGRWLALVDDLAAAGCLFLLITGGEPLLHRDFARIYRHARERGLVPTVFTNGSLIGETAVKLWREYPPRMVDITLYGATEATYARVTGTSGMRDRVWMAVERLLAEHIRVAVKMVVMTLNRAELPAVEAQARAWGVPFRLDGALFPRFDGDRAPLRYRLAPSETAAIELGDEERKKKWRAYYDKRRVPSADDHLFQCAAGKWAFHVDPEGMLRPCLMATHIGYDLKAMSFVEAWRRLTDDVAGRKMPPASPCAGCELKPLCGYCPPFAYHETGDEAGRSEYLCLLGSARKGIMQT